MRVLLVEDEANARDVYSRLLETDGHEVTTAGTASGAEAALAGDPFDVALVDVALGEGDGFAVLKLIKRARPGTRVVMMTAYDVVDASGRAGAALADAILTKPLRWANLRTAISQNLPGAHAR